MRYPQLIPRQGPLRLLWTYPCCSPFSYASPCLANAPKELRSGKGTSVPAETSLSISLAIRVNTLRLLDGQTEFKDQFSRQTTPRSPFSMEILS